MWLREEHSRQGFQVKVFCGDSNGSSSAELPPWWVYNTQNQYTQHKTYFLELTVETIENIRKINKCTCTDVTFRSTLYLVCRRGQMKVSLGWTNLIGD